MSVLTDLIYGGSNAVAGLTEGAVNDAIAKYGADKEIAFPDTAYFFPTIYAATGVKVKTLGDLPACVGVLKSLITNQEDLGQALNAGLATAVGAEILEGLKFVEPKDAYEEATVPGIGFVPDPIIRSLGVPLVTGDIPGVAVVLGKAENPEDAVKVVKDYQSKGIMTFMVGDVIEQCADAGVKMGLELRVIPLGHDVTAVIHVVTVAIRAALIFGNVQPGDLAGLLKYTKERVPAFVNTFGAIDNVVVSAGAGAIALGFPVVVDIDLGENQVPGALESCTDHAETVKKSLELRGIKIKSKELPIPVAFAAAFEGEIIRKADVKAEFWSAKNPTCELVLMKDADQVEDHKITLIGPDIDSGDLEYAMGTFIEVYGKKMQADFESVIERKIHAWFNYMEGVMHTGQRNQFRIRISKDAYDKGLRLTHFAEVLYHMITDEFEAVVDKCEVHLITDPVKATAFLNDVAMPRYNMRDDRLASMTDESVDRFFTCILCQSFAPAHCCVVTPERLGLCGAVSWLDAKATYELNPNGPSQPIMKEGCLDERTGRYEDVDEAVLNYSEMQALATGDERIKEKIELDSDVARLRLLESEHYNAQYRLDDTISHCENMIRNYSVNIESAKRDIEFSAAHQPSEDDFRVEIGGKIFTERKPAGEALQKAAIKFMAEASQTSHKPIGTFCGFELAIEKFYNGFNVSAGISLRKELTYNTDMDISGDIGNVTRLENLFSKGLERKLDSMTDKLARMQTDLTEAVAAKGKPFEHAAELAEKSARLEQLNRELEVGKAEDVIMDDEQERDSPAQTEEITKSAPKQKR